MHIAKEGNASSSDTIIEEAECLRQLATSELLGKGSVLGSLRQLGTSELRWDIILKFESLSLVVFQGCQQLLTKCKTINNHFLLLYDSVWLLWPWIAFCIFLYHAFYGILFYAFKWDELDK